ncbi:MAG: tetratricopeptide repeat protein [Elusimicrobia bacterium]|nr:tetratricopeptide repeat protein [Elusimicrobiota bacterium]
MRNWRGLLSAAALTLWGAAVAAAECVETVDETGRKRVVCRDPEQSLFNAALGAAQSVPASSDKLPDLDVAEIRRNAVPFGRLSDKPATLTDKDRVGIEPGLLRRALRPAPGGGERSDGMHDEFSAAPVDTDRGSPERSTADPETAAAKLGGRPERLSRRENQALEQANRFKASKELPSEDAGRFVGEDLAIPASIPDGARRPASATYRYDADAAVTSQRASSENAKRLIAEAVALGRRDLPRAIALATRAVREDPNLPDALNQRASLLAMASRYEEAVKDATRSLELAPERNQPALDARAFALAKLGRADAARADAVRALKLNAKDAYALLNLALVEELVGRYEEMARLLKAAVRLNERFYAMYVRRAQAHALPVDPLATITNPELYADPAATAELAAADARPAATPTARRKVALAALLGAVSLLLIAGLYRDAMESAAADARHRPRRVVIAAAASVAVAAGGLFVAGPKLLSVASGLKPDVSTWWQAQNVRRHRAGSARAPAAALAR